MPLDIDRILRETFVARAEHHPTIGSTNDGAAECAGQRAAALPLLIAADEQTAGRGRGTNRWWTGPGALAFSLLVEGQMVGADRSRSPLVSLAAALTLADTINALLPAHPVGICWPNDVLIAQRKVAGILVEVLPDRRHVIGIGLNTNNTLADAPAELRRTATTLRDVSGRTYDHTQVVVELLNRLQKHFSLACCAPEAIAARADALCLQRDLLLTLQWADRTVTGRCLGIAADGALLLETAAGRESFYSGTLLGQPPAGPL